LIKHDKISEATFPPNLLSIKRDGQDGSLYLMPHQANPFTLFLTTEEGRHFAITVNGQDGLGQFIVLNPQETSISQVPRLIRQTKSPEGAMVTPAAITLLEHMVHEVKLDKVVIQRPFNRVERLGQNLTLFVKALWLLPDLKGEVLEVYNSSAKPLILSESWFRKPGVQALQFTRPLVPPKSHTFVYRVWGTHHD